MIRLGTWAYAAALSMALGIRPTSPPADPDPTGTWRLLSDPGPAPPAFEIPLGVYDSPRNRLIVIDNGLMGRSLPIAPQILELGPEPRWSPLVTSGTNPGGRFLASLTYDPPRDRLLLFAGWGKNDLWALNLTGTPTWQQVVTSGGPPPWRAGHSAIYDPVRDRLIVFGGYADAQPSGLTFFADTWALSLQSNAWSALAPSGIAPPGREGHGAIYDPDGDRMLVFAGHDSYGYSLRNDLWALDLGDSPSWSELHPAGPVPAPRSAFGAIFDPVRRLMWIEGGVHTDAGVEPDEVWTLSLTGAPVWSPIATLDTVRGRSYPVAAYVPLRDQLVVFGGASYSQSAALPLAGPYRWMQFLPPQPPPEPGPRTGPIAIYDSRRDRFLALGGTFGSTDWDMWSFVPSDTGRWTPISTSPSPSVWSHLAVYDSLTDRIVLYDGTEIWTFSPETDPTWRRIVASGPRYRVGASIMLDPLRHRLLLYGGDLFEPHGSGGTTSQLWSLSLDDAPAWTLLGDGPAPYGSAGQAMFYDPLRDRMIVVGGYWRNGTSRTYYYGAAVWASPLDSALRWTQLNSRTSPQPLSPPSAQVVYDPRRDRLLVFAGPSAWSLRLDEPGPWSVLDVTGPAPEVTAPVVFDPVRDQVVALFSATTGEAPDQAWVLGFGPPPTTLLRASATFESVAIAWHSFSSIGRAADVERREESTAWASIARIGFDASGTASYEDRSVRPGARYAYRLAILEGSIVWRTDSVWVEVLPWPGLALERPRPNPGPGRFQVAFSLPDAGPARLELYDVRGRRLLERQVGGLGPGTHVIAIEPETRLPPGVYLLRLQHAGETRTARTIVIR